MIKSREDINRIRESKKADLEIRIDKEAAPTQTGGRIKRIQKYIGDETFLCTYGDGVSDIRSVRPGPYNDDISGSSDVHTGTA